MSEYYGDISEDQTLYIPFNTFDSNDPSASVTITNLADADIKVHKDGSVTQIVTDGATVAIDFDSITGNHLITIDTSAHADYSTGSDYMVRIEGTTVDGATINAWVGSFSIENRHSAGALRPTTAGRTLDVTATGAAGIDWGNVENASTAVDLSGTDIQLADTVTTVTGGATAAELAKVPKSDGTASWNATALGAINAECDTAISDYDPPTNAEMEARTLVAASYFDPAADTVATVTTVTNQLTAAAISDVVWDELLSGHAISGSTGEALSAAGTAGDPWTTALPGAYGAGTAGKIIGDNINAPLDIIDTNVDSILVDTAAMQPLIAKIPLSDGSITWNSTALASINAECDTSITDAALATAAALATVDSNVDAVLVDTNELQGDWTNGGRLDLILDIIAADTTTDIPALIATAQTDLDTITGADGVNLLSATQASIDAIEADTNELQGDWANGGRLDVILDARAAEATVAALNDISTANVNTEVVDVLFTDTHSELSSIPAANAPLADKINFIFMNIRNKMTQTATTATLLADDTTTSVGTSTVSDDGTTAIKGEWS